MHNLVDALEQACGRHRRALQAAIHPDRPDTLETPERVEAAMPRRRRYSGLPRNRPGPTAAERRSAARRARRLARYDEVIALRAGGESKLGIARRTGLDWRTVDSWLAAGHFPERAVAPPRPTTTDAFAEVLAMRIAAGEVNAAQLTRELTARGYQGTYQAVRLKVVKRGMYGRAKFDVLRKRVLHAA